MEMYLVRRYEDTLCKGDYGVSDNYVAIGLFSDKATAELVKANAIENAAHSDYEDKYSCCRTEIDIVPIEVNKVYYGDEQIFLGGGCYVE